MLGAPPAGRVAPDAYCERPSVLPTVPRFSVMLLSAAPSVHPVMPIVAGLGVVLASEPSLLNVIDTDPDVVPVVLLESDDSVGFPKLAVQVLSAVADFVQVTS